MIALGCNSQTTGSVFVTTSYPVSCIIKEIVGTKSEVKTLLPTGASPHTYAPTPSDMITAQTAKALFYVSNNLDGWASNLQTKNKVELINFVPKENILYFNNDSNSGSGVIDAHFWTDPLTVKSLLTKLVDTLSIIDPNNAATYRTNAELFSKRLDVIHRQAEVILKDIIGKPIFLFHPSFRYMLNRYGLHYAGALEPSPGKEPTPKYIASFIESIKNSKTKAIFSEPQLTDLPAKSIAESANVLLYELDPIGNPKNIKNYSDLILFNAKTLIRALK